MTGLSGTQGILSRHSSLESLGSIGSGHNTGDTTSLNTSTLEDGLSFLSIDGDGDGSDTRKPVTQFEPTQCLFCNCRSSDLEENLGHMLKAHGLFIPDKRHLIVDFETLIEYFHLVIFGYFECLFCGTQKSSAQAVQQHCLGKGHCKIDIESEDSEFRDFYNFEADSDDEDSDNEGTDNEDTESQRERPKAPFVDTDQSLRLPSGKVLSHRTQKPRPCRKEIPDSPSASSTRQPPAALGTSSPRTESVPDQGAPPDSKRLAKREATFVNQLASLRAEDRASLTHFPQWKQRAIIMESKRLVESARRDENKMLLKIQLKANP